MTLDISQLRADVRSHLGDVDEDDISTTNIDLLLNKSFWEIMDKFKFREKEISSTFTTTAGERLYKAPSPFEALRQLSIEDINTQEHSILEHIDIFIYEKNFVNRTDAQAKPEKYTREGDSIRLLPTPDDVYTIVMKYLTTLSDLSDDNPALVIPQVWHELIMFGAVWRGFLKLGDIAKGTAMRQHQTASIESTTPVEEKEKQDLHLAGLDVAGYDKQNL